MGWVEFIFALAVFFLSHSLPVRPAIRARAVNAVGPRGFTLAYSILSLAVLGWLVIAAGRAPHVPLWGWAPWQNHVALGVMLIVCLIVALVIGRPNPFSFGGAGNDRFDPANPGLIGWMRHPLLVALALWAGAHLLANGDLAHVILFGLFAGFALLGQRLIDRRKRREGGASWAQTLAAWRAGPRPTPWALIRQVPYRAALAVVAYAALLAAHPLVFGVSPLP